MAEERKRQRGMGCLGRLGLALVAVAAGAVPVYLWLPDAWVQWVLGQFYAADVYDLSDPTLLETYRLLLGLAAGLVVAVALGVIIAITRWMARRRAEAKVPKPIRDMRRALRKNDEAGMVAAAEQAATELHDDAVPDLLLALDRVSDDDSRQRIAAALFRLGRALTAEVELHPSR